MKPLREFALRMKAWWTRNKAASWIGPLVEWATLIVSAIWVISMIEWSNSDSCKRADPKCQLPVPGIAIGVLAAVAAIMTFAKPGLFRRVLIALVAAGLLFIEAKAIQQDRAQQQASAEKTLKAILDADRSNTQSVLNQSAGQFSSTENRFSAVIDRSENIRALSSQNLREANNTLNTLLGRGTFPILKPRWGLARNVILSEIFNMGRNPLLGVHVTIRKDNILVKREEIGTISKYMYRRGAEPLDIPTLGTPDFYDIDLDTQAGSYYEYIITKKIGSDVQYKFAVCSKQIVYRKSGQGVDFKLMFSKWKNWETVDQWIKVPVKSDNYFNCQNPNDFLRNALGVRPIIPGFSIKIVPISPTGPDEKNAITFFPSLKLPPPIQPELPNRTSPR